MEQNGRVTVDDGTHAHTWFTDPDAKQTRVLRRPSMDGIAMVTELCDLSRIPKTWKKQGVESLNATIEGERCRAFVYTFTGTRQPRPVRSVVWVDSQERPRKLLLQEQRKGKWLPERELKISYDASIEASTFALDYPEGAKIVDTERMLRDRLGTEDILASQIRDGLRFAIHDLIPIDDRSYYVVSSVRGTPEYLKQYPPRKRRMNLDYTALDVASQSRSHGSRGSGQQILLFGMEWQGVDYLWSLFVPALQNRPTNGADDGFVRIPMFANHMHSKQRDDRGVQLATRCDLDVPVDMSSAATLEKIIEHAREDMSMVSALYNETASLPIAGSIEDNTVQFTSFDKTTVKDYADDLRKTRWQMETGDWTGNDPPVGFTQKFTEAWVEPEDPTEHFQDELLALPGSVAGKIKR